MAISSALDEEVNDDVSVLERFSVLDQEQFVQALLEKPPRKREVFSRRRRRYFQGGGRKRMKSRRGYRSFKAKIDFQFREGR
ncbi:hypothetical protein LINGRAHAP2_LOCUS23521 [Linum grandiflorum]